MNRLIKLQIRNLLRNKLFYVCLALTLITPIANLFFAKTDPVMVSFIGFIKGELGLISTIFIAIFCCYDYNEGTTKNIIARGYTKAQLFFSKYIVSLIGLFAMYLIVFIVTFVLFIKNGMGYESNMLYIIINSMFKIFAESAFFVTLAFLLEKNTSAIIACLFVPNIFPLLLSLVKTKLNIDLAKYWLDNISDKFSANPTLGNLNWTILFYSLYVIVFLFIGTRILKRKEIK
ncbi:MAG: ABC transporter permease [Bacilli bacterium]|nr:ABC transporter permease [Bacilli bacterium]